MGGHLLVALSAHGYGHAAMTAPVVQALRRRRPGLAVSVQSAVDPAWMRGCYGAETALWSEPIGDSADFGLVMRSILEVDVAASHHRYRRLHAGLAATVSALAAKMRRSGVDLVLSNVSYVALLAAREAGIPAYALSCLNWLDLFGHYCGGLDGAQEILAEIRAGYASARAFLRPSPAMPMPGLPNLRSIGPLARQGRAAPDRLRALIGAAAHEKVGLIAFGGMAYPLDYSLFPRLPGWKWVLAGDPCGHPDLIDRETVPMAFGDLLASSDVILGKPGYGTFTEAAVNGVPMLHIPRPDWPEAPYMIEWLRENGRCLEIEGTDLFVPARLEQQLQKLFSLPAKALPAPSGIDEAADLLAAALPAD